MDQGIFILRPSWRNHKINVLWNIFLTAISGFKAVKKLSADKSATTPFVSK